MTSLLLGFVGKFDRLCETFTVCLERVDLFLVANDLGQCAAGASAAVRGSSSRKREGLPR